MRERERGKGCKQENGLSLCSCTSELKLCSYGRYVYKSSLHCYPLRPKAAITLPNFFFFVHCIFSLASAPECISESKHKKRPKKQSGKDNRVNSNIANGARINLPSMEASQISSSCGGGFLGCLQIARAGQQAKQVHIQYDVNYRVILGGHVLRH